LPVFCDESGGVGRGVMTVAAVYLADGDGEMVIDKFRATTGFRGELKGSRIDLEERSLLFDLLADSSFAAHVAIAISATKPDPGEDRGDHDIEIYLSLLREAVGSLLPKSHGCNSVTMDDGRYGPDILEHVRREIGMITGPFGLAQLELSHMSAGLQIADVVSNSFFNRALVNDRQARMAAVVQPMLDDGRIIMTLLADREPEEI
jgi:hypothetical protein